MTTRPIPPHGSEARYQGAKNRRPCRCRTCIDGWTRAGQKRLLARLAGRPATIPAEPVTRHLNQLYAANMTTGQIVAASGTDASTVRSHAAGKFPAIRRTTAEKLLAVRPSRKADAGWVPALGTIRRCRALYTLGHGAKAIAAAHPDLQLRTVEYIIRGSRQHVTVALHNAMRDAYRALSRTPGASSQAKLRAAKEGWAGPLAWDAIDDPDCQPETEHHASYAKASSKPKVFADPARVARLTAEGLSAEQIANRIGCHKRTVVRARGRVQPQKLTRHPQPEQELAA